MTVRWSSGRWRSAPDVWRREAAKIAVAVGSRVYPPDWRTSSDALRLRDWMNDRDPSTPDGTAPRLVPTAPPATAPLARDDEHLVFFQRFGDEIVYIIVILFGTACFAVPTDSTGGACRRRHGGSMGATRSTALLPGTSSSQARPCA